MGSVTPVQEGSTKRIQRRINQLSCTITGTIETCGHHRTKKPRSTITNPLAPKKAMTPRNAKTITTKQGQDSQEGCQTCRKETCSKEFKGQKSSTQGEISII